MENLVSVLGTGRMGKALVKTLAPHVGRLRWGTRDPQKLAALIEKEEGLSHVEACSYEKALDNRIIIHTLWLRHLLPLAEANREQLAEKILVDVTNPFTEDFTDFILPWGTSAAEQIQQALPQTSVVGAFKNTYFQVFDQPVHQGMVSDCFVTSDVEDAKRQVLSLFARLPFRLLDGGALANNRTIERMTLFEREIALRYKSYPYVSLRLFGIDEQPREEREASAE
ncbi:reductase [Brevibacillus fluminis]|uniref:Reductase n=1 Tax=Brevibacillus fluminis TaxID=511487 RepID=A0A3M8CUS1_9BACL|nr:NAD(P)-binding domain-containing protein [Brevibacillus fluminis]RNB79556.1 reductase [Brevibacillus fluminis]